jgi:hypothetical protein
MNEFLREFNEGRIEIDVLYNTWAKNYNWVNLVSPKTVIYHSCDSFDDWKIYEKQMMDYSDIVLCTSQFLYDLRKTEHHNVHLVRNGCTGEFLDAEWTLPEEMKFIKPPIFNFTGAVGQWVSTYLLKQIANDYATVFVGTKFGKDVPDNLFNFGVKEHDDLINYYCSSDICLLPFSTNSEITQAACPIKLYEYLSCGKPVLATSWDETTLKELEGVVFPAKTNSDFIELGHELAKLTEDQKIKIAIKAKEVAANNTWQKRFEQIEELIQLQNIKNKRSKKGGSNEKT